MGIWSRLFSRQPPSDTCTHPFVDPEAFQALAKRVEELERIQLDRELQWTETKDKLLRYLKRVQELDRRDQPQEPETPAGRPSLSSVISAKFPRQTGG